MRFRTVMVPLVVAVPRTWCVRRDDDDDDDAGGGGGLSLKRTPGPSICSRAVAPEEGEAVQAIFDELINSEADYTAEIEASADFEEQFQIRAEGGTLDLAAVPQPGCDNQALVDDGVDRLARRHRFDVSGLNDLMGESFVELGVIDGEHYGLPTKQPQEHDLVSEGRLRRSRLHRSRDVEELITLERRSSPTAARRGASDSRASGASGWPATDWMEDIMLRTWPRWLRRMVGTRDPVQRRRSRRRGSAVRRSDVRRGLRLGRRRGHPRHRLRRHSRPDVRGPARLLVAPAGDFHQCFLPGGPRSRASTTTGSLPVIDQEGVLYGGEFTVVGTAANRPEVVDFLEPVHR